MSFGIVGYREIAPGEGWRPDLPPGWGFVEIDVLLAEQPDSPFFLARLDREEIIGAALAGEWVWVTD